MLLEHYTRSQVSSHYTLKKAALAEHTGCYIIYHTIWLQCLVYIK